MSHLHAQRLASVRDEFLATRAALRFARAQAARLADITEFSAVDLRLIERSLRNAEGTHLIRLFAEFESILREYRQSLRPGQRPTRIDAERLIASVAARLRVDDGIVLSVHEVRRYRNAIVHTGNGALVVDFTTAFRNLNRFLYWLP